MINQKMNYNKNRLMRIGVILSIFAMIVSCFTGGVIITQAGDTIIVDDDGTGDYTSIQDAIDNASPGDYIVVKDGTYSDQLTVNVSVTISAASGETPTLYLSAYDVGIDVTAPDVLIEGLEIFGNGSLTGGPFPTIRASAGSDGLIVNNNDFKVFTGEVGQMALLIVNNVSFVTFNSGNNVINYEHSVFHAALISGTDIYFGSIQDAIAFASVGATINVVAGTYNQQITVNKDITLYGTVGETIIDLGSTPTYAIKLEQNCDGATIRNLEIINSYGIYVDSNAGGEGYVTIQNNHIHDLFVSVSPELTGGFFVNASCWPPLENWTIQGNTLKNITGSLSSGLRPENMKNVVISGNTISNMGYSGILLINVDGAIISNNFVNNTVRAGIQVDSYCTRGIEITNNIVTKANTGSHSGYGGIRFYGQHTPDPHGDPPAEITVTGNTCSDNYNGLAVRDGENISGRNISVNSNSFINNSNMGVYHGGTGILDATNNWWGNISGPYHPTSNPDGIGDNVSDNVTYRPWYEFDGYSIAPRVEKIIGLPQAEDGLYVSDNTHFRLEAVDNESGISSLTYRIWNTTHRWSSWHNYTGAFTLSGEGKHLLEYNATDKAGTKTMETQIHYVDTQEPWVEVSYPDGGEFLRGLVSIHWNASDKIIDQEQQKWNYSWSLTNDYPGHIQSFIPMVSTLNSISLLLSGDEAEVTLILFSSITPIPVPIAETSEHLEDIGNENNPEWVEFAFDSDIILDINTTYYIGVTQEIIGNIGYKWYYYNSTGGVDPYLYGQSWLKKTDVLESYPQWDWGFRTMYWENDLNIDIQYSPIGGVQWITLADDESNDGTYVWDTTSFPDGISYKIKIIAYDKMEIMGFDESDEVFTIDQTGPTVTDIIINDVTIGNTNYVKDGDDIKITATITGDPVTIKADLSGFGKGSSIPPTKYIGTTATWDILSVACSPSDGTITVIINATDPNGDASSGAGEIVADNSAPDVYVLRPLPGIYLWDSQRLLPYAYPVVFGEMTVRIDADDFGSGIEKVEFYRTYYPDSELMAIIEQEPYEWLWDEREFGFFKVKAIAYDTVGLNATALIDDIFLINFDFIN
jgi:hypothetical protein